jgi:signal transduction histidine kinase
MLLAGPAQAIAGALHILRLEERTLTHLTEAKEARLKLKSLSAKLVSTQEDERRNISRELA